MDEILSALPSPAPIISVMGDFNFTKETVSWIRTEEGLLSPIVANHREGETAGGKQDRLQARHLIDMASKHSLLQQVDQVTHAVEILDLMFTNDSDLVSSVQTEDWPTFSDHRLITLDVTYRSSNDPSYSVEQSLCSSGNRYRKLNFLQAPWEQIKVELGNVDWEEVEKLADVDTAKALIVFHEKILGVLEMLIPMKKKPRKKSKLKINKMRRNLWRRLAKVKKNTLKASSIQKLTDLIQRRRALEEQLKADYAAENAQEEDQAVFNLKSNPKSFFSFARSRQKTKSSIGPFLDQDSGKLNPDPSFGAEVLRKQYDSVFSQPRPEWIVTDVDKHFSVNNETGNILDDFEFSPEDIELACGELKESASAGPDGVPASLLRTCRKQLSSPLYKLWRASLNKGKIPDELLLVLICPIHKGGNKSLPKNYRPVALTSHLIKVFERVLRRVLVKHIEDNDILPNGQHGSRALRSTLTQLLSHWDTVLDGLEQGSGVDCIYLDFSKAFDKVETGVLLHKLKEAKIMGKTGKWIASFLDSNYRMQAVAVEGAISTMSPVISGVPQGTVLGPILFLLHIADIASNISADTTVSSYVDDTRVQRSITDTDQDCRALQDDLATIYSWAERVNMIFNCEKFECLRYWPSNTLVPDNQYMSSNSTPIQVKEHLRDLGVELSSNLKFEEHIGNVVTSANRIIGWAMRTFRRRSRTTMLTIWKSLVQPRLDYCSQLWSPTDQASIGVLEGVQRNFTRMIEGMNNMDYLERLRHLNMYSQERRRERYQIIFIWKLSQGLVQGYNLEFSYSDRRGRMVIPHPIMRQAPAKVRKAREATLGVKGARIFNLLPAWIRTISGVSVDKFKSELDRFLAGVPDQPTVPTQGRAATTNSLVDQLQLIF